MCLLGVIMNSNFNNNTDREETAKKILSYWNVLSFLEFINPESNNKSELILLESQEDIPWNKKRNTCLYQKESKKAFYQVYYGKMKTDEVIENLLKKCNVDYTDNTIEKDNSEVFLLCLTFNTDGTLIFDSKKKCTCTSFAMSKFMWAVYKAINKKTLDIDLDSRDFNKFQRDINSSIVDEYQKGYKTVEEFKKHQYTLNEIEGLLDFVFSKIGTTLNVKEKMCYGKPILAYYIKSNSKYSPISTDCYGWDLHKIRNDTNIPNILLDFICACDESNIQKNNRVEINNNPENMVKWLSPEKFPMGLWPSKYHPGLMQQIAINIATSYEEDIFSVNGPPGTGKTTLLKEIIASNVVQRAKLLSEYGSPDDAFDSKACKLCCPIDTKHSIWYELENKSKDICKYSIIVASNNNAAVENLSKELPKSITDDKTGLFSKNQDNTYFGDIASKLISKDNQDSEPAFGLISVALGKQENIKEFVAKFWCDSSGFSTLKNYYENSHNSYSDWKEACGNFNEIYNKVVNYREIIKQDFNQLSTSIQKLSMRKIELENLTSEEKNIEVKLQMLNNCKFNLEQQYSHCQATLNALGSRVPPSKLKLYKWLTYKPPKGNIISIKRVLWKLLIDNEVQQYFITYNISENISLQINNNKLYLESLISSKNDIQHKIKELKKDILNEKQTVCRIKDKYEAVTDSTFWDNIETNGISQSSCPWTNDEYDKLREELFYKALMLNKAFVLSSKCVRTNIDLLCNYWNTPFNFAGSDVNEFYSTLLNTLLLVVPVVSTTFAAASNFLGRVGKGELGTLIIDEAGQATPHSAVGSIWRAQEAIVVGDPLQVEPIFSIPKEFIKQIAKLKIKDNNLTIYRAPDLSVQMLADNANIYGGYSNNSIWLGCPLIIHRRCQSPMFDISNKIAYNNRMINKTPGGNNLSELVFPCSAWIDIKGKEKGNKDHSVEKQTEVIKDIVTHIKQNKANANVFIITPFTTVNAKIKPIVKSSDIASGTIHTFQGKEAEEVILVLGCDGSDSGKAAANWVGQKPNIINVAVSRAKKRLIVIGDYDLWKNVGYVDEICKQLCDYKFNSFEELLNQNFNEQ